jgi:leucyl-tRNA synthetase
MTTKFKSELPSSHNMADFHALAQKWQKKWADAQLFKFDEHSTRPKFYCLEMFPYPSGYGLHMGHARNYTMGDVIARFKRMQGYNVLYPMGYDAFGLPAENAAIKNKTHPLIYTQNSMAAFTRQLNELGNSYDWSRTLATCDPEYYRWNQWFFLQFYKRGLVEKRKAPINWCPSCQTVLANEQVEKGKCWRCGSIVVVKDLEQWFVKITNYAEDLLQGLGELQGWPEKIRTMQENWIGKSTGTLLEFEVRDGKPIQVFTTRPDTLYGVTFLVFAPEHPRVLELVDKKHEAAVKEFINKVVLTEKFTRAAEDKPKEGMFIGAHAIHPLTGEEIPIYIANFVLPDYGTGCVMAVPAHDERDWDFAQKYGLPIKQVVMPRYGEPRPDAEFRKTVAAVVMRKDGKILALKWKKFPWISIPIGGVDEGETPETAAEREVLEETGYRAKAVKKLGLESEMHFFADNKNVWRHRLDQPVLLELVDEHKVRVDDEESARHESFWLTPQELMTQMTHEYNLNGLKHLLKNNGAYTGVGYLVNSGKFNGMKTEEAKHAITKELEHQQNGKATTQYKIRDWLISRQRYWGTPIPIVYCEKCGVVPVPEHELPVRLPEDVEFTGEGNPLLTSHSLLHTRCPTCGGDARRETDTMDTFVDSSWYFLRYCNPHDDKEPFNTALVNKLLPVDQYIGGAEHAVMHLLYARFFTRVLYDMKLVSFKEPFKNLFNQGTVTKDGAKMSKSVGNIVTQDEIAEKYGIDTGRFFLMFVASPESELEWSDEGVEGSYRFLNRVFNLLDDQHTSRSAEKDKLLESKRHRCIKETTRYLDSFELNKALIVIMEFANALVKHKGEISEKEFRISLNTLAHMLLPFTPHLAEEMNERLGGHTFLSASSWPLAEENKISERIELDEEYMEEIAANIRKNMNAKNIKQLQSITLYQAENWKYVFVQHFRTLFERFKNPGEIVTELRKVPELESHQEDVMKLSQAVVKNMKILPLVDRTKEEEHVLLQQTAKMLERMFSTTVHLGSHASEDPKAKNGLPGKPAVVLH